MTFDQLTQVAHTIVENTRRRLPAEIADHAARIPVHYEHTPDDDVLADGFEPDILGLFSGSAFGADLREDQSMPPQIILYLDNLWDFAEGDAAVYRDEVRTTFLHELGHYFGWDEDDLADRGLD